MLKKIMTSARPHSSPTEFTGGTSCKYTVYIYSILQYSTCAVLFKSGRWDGPVV